jgi:hypothetical protein
MQKDAKKNSKKMQKQLAKKSKSNRKYNPNRSRAYPIPDVLHDIALNLPLSIHSKEQAIFGASALALRPSPSSQSG